jgi:hypothetical protein
MTVVAYAESNLLLEIALQQSEAPAAEGILSLAETGQIALKLPDFSLAEPFSTVVRRRNERQSLAHALRRELQQFSRSTAEPQLALAIQPAIKSLLAIFDQQLPLLDATMRRVLALGPLIGTDLGVYDSSLRYRQVHGLRSQDALIYASVVKDLRTRRPEEVCVFLNRNAKDFDAPSIRIELQALNCRSIASFEDGLQFLRNAIGSGGAT